MTLALLIFGAIFLLAFAITFLMLRVPPAERTIEHRLASFQALAPLQGKAPRTELAIVTEPRLGRYALVWLRSRRMVRHLEELVYQSRGTRQTGSTLLAVGGAFLLGAAIVLFLTDMPPLAGLTGILMGTLPIVHLYWRRQLRLKAFELALPECIETCARALRAGHSLVAAIGIVAEDAPEPARTEFADLFRKHNFGLPLKDAFLEMLERVPSADLRVFVTGILVQKDTGGNLTEIFDRIVAVIRERIRIHGEIRVHTTQGRLTGWILTALPVVLLLVINVLNPGYSQPLFVDPVGRKLLYAGVGCLLMGALSIRRIINGIEV